MHPKAVKTLADFERLPVLEKRDTFQRFGVDELCAGGTLGRLGSVLTSSGHSGIFAFGLSGTKAPAAAARWIDGLLDHLFAVRSRRTLLINCLPMGVKIYTQACTLAETSVRPDMAIALVRAFARHFAQIIFVGDPAFIKLLLELGVDSGVDWHSLRIHVIVGEEPLAENARKYIETILGLDVHRPENGVVISSMGVAELGLNLFSEVPPLAPLILLRRTLHDNPELRHAMLGLVDWVPSLFTYDPRRLFVEFDSSGRLILTTLDPRAHLPLIRYATGDRGNRLGLPLNVRPALEAAGIPWELLASLPVVTIQGRGNHVLAGQVPLFPEGVKEGIYHNAALARQTTANFRLAGGSQRARIRIQLSAGISTSPEIERQFQTAISLYVRQPFEVVCETYETFGSGMTLDYERKFQYLGP